MLHVLQSVLTLLGLLTVCSAECNELPKLVSHVIPSSSESCPNNLDITDDLNQLKSRVNEIINREVAFLQQFVPNGCPGIGWRKVVDINATSCPSGWERGNRTNIQTCEIPKEMDCISTTFAITPPAQYSDVCGRARGYQIGPTAAFSRYLDNNNIEGNYLDGISITHGAPRTHIWSFAVGCNAAGSRFTCPCSNSTGESDQKVLASHVQDNYFCDSGTGSDTCPNNGVFLPDSLWHDAACLPDGCCRESPYFYRKLDMPTCDGLEVRLCHDQNVGIDSNVTLDLLELYVR